LSRSCQFMLTEEAHHMFVGESGVNRVIRRACELMTEHDTDDIAKYGGISLDLIQKHVNFHFSVSVDLFGQELSTNAATYYTAGIKGRFNETKIDDDHLLTDASYPILELLGDKIVEKREAALNAVNERLRDEYIVDCQRGVDRWNKSIKEAGIDFEIKLPHRAFHRGIGTFSEVKATPEGKIITEAEWNTRHAEWLPTEEDRAFVQSLMVPVTEPGKFAGWIAPPARGINQQPVDFEYVRLT